jgi:hypothetical protein
MIIVHIACEKYVGNVTKSEVEMCEKSIPFNFAASSLLLSYIHILTIMKITLTGVYRSIFDRREDWVFLKVITNNKK